MIDEASIKLLHSSTLADVLDTFGVWGVLSPEIHLLNQSSGPIYGRAYTVRWAPVRKPRNIMRAQPSTWEDVKNFLVPDVQDGKGLIYVAGVDGGLLKHLALAGGFSSTDFNGRGFNAMILGGAIRDANVVRELTIPVWATNYTPADTQGNYRVSEVGASCMVGEIHVQTNDFIFADDTGCVVIPEKLVNTVLARALEIELRERIIEERVSSGEKLWDVVHDLGRI